MPNTHIVLKRLSVGDGKLLVPGDKVNAEGYRNLAILEAGPDAYLRRMQDAERERAAPSAEHKKSGSRKKAGRRRK